MLASYSNKNCIGYSVSFYPDIFICKHEERKPAFIISFSEIEMYVKLVLCKALSYIWMLVSESTKQVIYISIMDKL
jgi:hypothetical protein